MNAKLEAQRCKYLTDNTDINYFEIIEKYNKVDKRLHNLGNANERDSQIQEYNLYLYNHKYFYSPLIEYWQLMRDFYNLVLSGYFPSKKEANVVKDSINCIRPYYTSPIY